MSDEMNEGATTLSFLCAFRRGVGLDNAIEAQEAEAIRAGLVGKVPIRWLKLPLTDAHARELGQKLFFRGIICSHGHLSPYRINGGCLKCAGTVPNEPIDLEKSDS